MKPIIRTFTGREINPLDIRPENIDIRDIAHGLAMVPRFAGQTRRPIYIGQHSVYVWHLCKHLPIIYQIQALVHDGTEAYLGDVTKWLKMDECMAGYRAAEDVAWSSICTRYRLPTELHSDVELADRIMVRYEGAHQHGFGKAFIIDHPNYPPLTPLEIERVGHWQPWGWMAAEEIFLNTFASLGGASR